MKCPRCQFENREGAKFCKECGTSMESACPKCKTVYQLGSKFCDECGYTLAQEIETVEPAPGDRGERKHVTVLFSDLSGYTTMAEKLDPEEVKEITGHIFGAVSKIVNKYDGFIEKYAGDAVMVLFGADQSHEDDPMRAIRTASEIHDRVENLSPLYEERIGSPLNMHSGINTGLVVTGELNLEKGVHGVAGDAINVAARLSAAAKPGEILVDHETYTRTQGYFQFEDLESIQLKGKTIPIRIHRFLSAKNQPHKIHRLHGLRARLIGRTAELDQLSEAVANMRKGQGAVISIIGSAGTGKSRLVEEFKASLDLKEIQWHEGYAFSYTQNIPYFPLINLMNRAFEIEEGDPPQSIKEKIEQGLDFLAEEKAGFAPYLGSLYSITYPEIENVSPEFWKLHLQKTIQALLAGLAQRAPTVVCFEDLHWMDPSTLELVRSLLSEIRHPILFIPTFRQGTTLLSSHQINNLPFSYAEINLKDLSHADLADSEDDMARVGMFYAGMGLMEWERVQFRAAYQYLHKALEIGEKIGNEQIIGYACTLLAFTYAELGLLGDEAVAYGKRAHEIAKNLESDHFLYFKSLLGLAHIYVIRGQSRQPAEISKMLLEYGQKFHNIRSLAVGHTCMGYSHYASGNFPSAIECFQQAAEIAVDPFYYHLPRYMTGLSYVRLGEFHNAEAPIKEVLSYSQNNGCDIFIDFARACLGIILISRGDFSKGLNLIEKARQSALKSERKWLCAVAENILGNVYSQIGARTGPASLSVTAKNAGFLMKNIPFAAKKAEDHFKKAIEVAKEIGAPGLLGQSYFNLGLLYKSKKKTGNAKECISAAITLFEECEADEFLKQAREAMESLKD